MAKIIVLGAMKGGVGKSISTSKSECLHCPYGENT